MKRSESPSPFRWDTMVAQATSTANLGPCTGRKCVIHPLLAGFLGLMLVGLMLGCYALDLGQTLSTWARIAAPVHHAQAAELPHGAAALALPAP